MQAQRISENRNAEKLHRTAISRNQTILPPSKNQWSPPIRALEPRSASKIGCIFKSRQLSAL